MHQAPGCRVYIECQGTHEVIGVEAIVVPQLNGEVVGICWCEPRHGGQAAGQEGVGAHQSQA